MIPGLVPGFILLVNIIHNCLFIVQNVDMADGSLVAVGYKPQTVRCQDWKELVHTTRVVMEESGVDSPLHSFNKCMPTH